MLALFLLVIATSFNASLEVSDRASRHAAAATKTTHGHDDFAAWMLSSSITEEETKDSLSDGSQVQTENVADDHSALPKPSAAPQVDTDRNALFVFHPDKVAVIAALVREREVVAQPALNHTNTLAVESALEEIKEKASSDDLNSAASALNPSLKTGTASGVSTINKSDDVADVVFVGRTEPAQMGETPAGSVAHVDVNLSGVQPRPGDNEHSLSSRVLTRHLLHRSSIAPDLTTDKSTVAISQHPLIAVAIVHAASSAPHLPSPVVDVLPKADEVGISTSRPASRQSVQISLVRQAETVARPPAVVGDETADELDLASMLAQSKDVAVGQHGLTSTQEITTQASTVHSSKDVTFAYSFGNQSHITQDENEVKTASERIGPAVELTGAVKGPQPVQRLDVSVDDPVLGNVGLRAEIRGGILHASISGDTSVAASLPDLHQFLQRSEIAVHTLTMRHTESQATFADPVGRMIGAGSALAQGGNSDAHQHGESQRREPWETKKYRESSEREEADMGVQQTSPAKPTTTNVNQGSILSIHI